MTRETTPYTSSFYDEQAEGSERSARKIIPYVLQLVPATSVIDVGCGVGPWLKVCQDNGVSDVLGVDGDYVDRARLRICRSQFVAADLCKALPIQRRFDLAISMEVAEHLPLAHASPFVHELTRLADVVLFSAAVPGQCGTRHLNEQWPRYWAGLFEAVGFCPLDCLRRRFWEDDDVDWWYRQNILLFVKRQALSHYPRLAAEAEHQPGECLSLIHPRAYAGVLECLFRAIRIEFNPQVGPLVRALPGALRRSFLWRLRKMLHRR